MTGQLFANRTNIDLWQISKKIKLRSILFWCHFRDEFIACVTFPLKSFEYKRKYSCLGKQGFKISFEFTIAVESVGLKI